MQTRRDQLQAYKFQNRRALAALVTGEPNVVEPPMRRLTVTTISGIMIAVLVTIGFTVFGLIRPKAGDSWKEAGSIIVEQDTGATYVLLQGMLRPVVNYASAVLAVGNNPHVVEVEHSDLGSTPRGSRIGIPDLPASLPSAGRLVSDPVSVCSRQRENGNGDVITARVSVALGDDSDARTLPARSGVVVNTGPGTQDYLLLGGHRLAIDPGRVSTSLRVGDADTLQVGTAFLNAVPAGADLKAPSLPLVGKGSPVRVGSVTALVGQLLHAEDTDDYYVAMSDGVSVVNSVQRALLLTLPLSGGRPLAPIDTSKSVALGFRISTIWPSVVSDQLADLPNEIGDYDMTAPANGGVCAEFSGKSAQPVFAVPPNTLPTYRTAGVSQTAASRAGRADEVRIAPGRAAVVRSADGSGTVFLVSDSGIKFAASSNDVLAGFGYGKVTPLSLPAELLPLIPTGSALNASEARRPVTG